VSVKSITFEALKAKFAEPARAGQAYMPSAKQVPNAVSALASFLRERELSASAVVGETLRGGFPAALAAHTATLQAEDKSNEYCRNRRWLLSFWSRFVRELDHEVAVAANAPPPLTIALLALFADGKPKPTPTAREINVAPHTLRRWLAGSVPHIGHCHGAIDRLESVCGLVPGALAGLLPRKTMTRVARLQAAPPMDEAEAKFRALMEDAFALPAAVMKTHPVLYPQWQAYLTERTLNSATSGVEVALTSDRINRKNAATALSLENPLRLRAPKDGEKVAWFENVSGNKCPTAGTHCDIIRRLLGWASRSIDDGGAGVPLENLTLGLCADVDLITRYFSWNLVRRGAPTLTDIDFLTNMKTLLTAGKGFVVRTPSIGATVGIADPEAWKVHCAKARADIHELRKKWVGDVKRLRGPKKKLAGVLKLEEPIEAFKRGAKRLEADRYSTGYAGSLAKFYERDAALYNLVLSNPLRPENYSGLTYHADNTGELHKKPDGSWHITIPWWKMKNINGAAKDTDYDREVNPIVWPHIDAYLKIRDQFRASPHFFAPCTSKGALNYLCAKSLSQLFRKLVATYVPEQPRGCGIQGMRHIWATVIVSKYRDYSLAAQILHDKESTVAKNYAHAMPEAGRRQRDKLIAPMLSGVPHKPDRPDNN